MTPPVRIEAKGWGWRHAGRRAWTLRGLDLVVEPGERVLLLGPSGSGKSTLLLALAGLLDPGQAGEAEGLLRVDNVDPRAARDRSGLLLQDPETNLVMARSGDDVAFGLENRAVPVDQIWPRVDDALAAVGFPYGRERSTAALSGGEQQRLALAGVLALRPGLLLLDEPTTNLDPLGAGLVRDAIAAAQEATGATTVLVEHRVAEALPLVDRVVVIASGGGVVVDGTPEEVFAGLGEALAAGGVWVPRNRPPRRLAGKHHGEGLLKAQNVSYVYPGTPLPAVLDASVQLHAGELLAVTGPNGSGKSTLAMLVSGLLGPSGGRVTASPGLAGADARHPVHRWPARRLIGRIGTVFQNPEHQFLTSQVRTELSFGPRRAGMTDSAVVRLVDALLDRLGLARLAEANPYTLSGGEKRRLSVATALASNPRLLVLDEPTFGQDRRTWSELVDMLAAHRDSGGSVCAVTHDDLFVEAVADRVISIAGGRVASTAAVSR